MPPSPSTRTLRRDGGARESDRLATSASARSTCSRASLQLTELQVTERQGISKRGPRPSTESGSTGGLDRRSPRRPAALRGVAPASSTSQISMSTSATTKSSPAWTAAVRTGAQSRKRGIEVVRPEQDVRERCRPRPHTRSRSPSRRASSTSGRAIAKAPGRSPSSARTSDRWIRITDPIRRRPSVGIHRCQGSA